MTKENKKTNKLVQSQVLILSIWFDSAEFKQLTFASNFPCCLGGIVGGNDDISHQRWSGLEG